MDRLRVPPRREDPRRPGLVPRGCALIVTSCVGRVNTHHYEWLRHAQQPRTSCTKGLRLILTPVRLIAFSPRPAYYPRAATGSPGSHATISELDTQPTDTPVQRFKCSLTTALTWLGARVVRYSFSVRLFHSLLHAGLSRRYPGPSVCATFGVHRFSSRLKKTADDLGSLRPCDPAHA